jgi:NAD(P)-dependent dehydrogenase (short-subunit alcohol dehydrogenase family)
MGHVSAPKIAAYASAKGGVSQLARTLALEWAQHGVRVNALCPGYVRTPFLGPTYADPARLAKLSDRVPLRRLAEPEELAGPAVFLASDAASYVTGSSLFVDGGAVAW